MFSRACFTLIPAEVQPWCGRDDSSTRHLAAQRVAVKLVWPAHWQFYPRRGRKATGAKGMSACLPGQEAV